MAAPTEIAGEFATDGRKYHLVDDKAKKEHQSWEQAYRVSRPQTRLAGVAEPSENASGLIADVPLDDGFSLEPVCLFPGPTIGDNGFYHHWQVR